MKTTCLAAAVALVLGIGAAGTAQADVLTFDGLICDNGGVACGNGQRILDTYGDIAGQLDVEYDADLAQAINDDRLLWWADSYSGMVNIAYGENTAGGSAAEIYLRPLAGYQVTLVGFDLGAWPNANQGSQITVRGGNGSLVSSTGPIIVLGSTPTHTTVNLTRSDGFRIQWGPDNFNVGIDNIEFTVSEITAGIPEPATWAMMILGFGGVGASIRARRRFALA